jgi:tetratricopeptide (TPR) repeat protein
MALNLDPNLDYLHNNLGYSYLLQGNLDEAILAFQKAVALNDRENRFHNNLGLAYAEKGQYDLALAEFKLASDEAKAHYNMAQVYFKKGLFEEAKSHYAMALKINPSLTIVRTGLKAADALARIFEQIPNKAEPKRLVIPDQPVVRTAEMEKPVPSDQSATVNSESEKEVFPKPSTHEASETNQLASRVQPPMPIDKEEQTVSIDQGAEIKQLTSLKNVGIEISNGNGAHRMAKKVGDYLKERGLKVTRLTNANHFKHTETRIFYQKEYDEAAEHVAEHLPVFQSKEKTEKFDRPNIKIKIVIGKDLIPHLKTFENGKKA